MAKEKTKKNAKKSLIEKLLEIRKSVDYLQKEKEGYQFKYVSSSQILGAFKRKMDEVGVILLPSITEVSTHRKEEYRCLYYISESGKVEEVTPKEHFTEIWIRYTWINVDDPIAPL